MYHLSMNEALEDEDLKGMYILSDLRGDLFKDMRWELNHGVSGCRVTDMDLKIYIYTYIYICVYIFKIKKIKCYYTFINI